MKLDLGCGPKAAPGYVGVDFHAPYNPDIVADITQHIPLEDGSVQHIRCYHVLEHIPGQVYYQTILEMMRVLKQAGTVDIRVPHPSCDGSMIQGHCHVLTPYWWNQMKNDDWFRGVFKIIEIEEVLDPRWMGNLEKLGNPPPEVWCHFRNVYFETHVWGYKA